MLCCDIVLFKQKAAYEFGISDWSSDVCSSDLVGLAAAGGAAQVQPAFVFTTRHGSQQTAGGGTADKRRQTLIGRDRRQPQRQLRMAHTGSSGATVGCASAASSVAAKGDGASSDVAVARYISL